ncbi:MAG: AAA family ATPase [Myxococcota bacterium]
MATKFDLSKFTESARNTLERGQNLASTLRHQHVDAEHALLAILEQDDHPAKALLEATGADTKRLGRKLIDELELMPKSYRKADQVFVAKNLLNLLDDARAESQKQGDEFVTPEHMVIAISLGRKGYAGKALRDAGATGEALREAYQDARKGKRVTSAKGPGSGSGAPGVLEKFATDLTQLATEGELQRVIGRDTELRRVMQVLSRKIKNNPVLLGEPGVGKTAIIEALAQRIVADDVPIGLRGKKIMSLDVGSLVAGTSLRGQFEERMKAVIEEIVSSDGEILLFIDEIHTMVGAGGGDGPMNAAGLLKPALARGTLSIIGTTTIDEYRQYIETDPALERRFQTILVEEPSQEQCLSILRGIKQNYEIHHNVQIMDSALVSATKMTDRYITDRALPDKAIDAIDEAASRLRLEIDSKPTELDELERRIISLEVERQALEDEANTATVDARRRIDAEIKDLRAQAETMHERWEREKEILDVVTKKKEEYEATEREMQEAQRKGELGRAAEMKYSVLPKIKGEIERAQDSQAELLEGPRLLKDYVDESDVAGVIGDWTGIPVSKMVESEREKLLRMPDRLSERVIGQDAAIAVISQMVQTSRAGLQESNRPIGNFMFIGPTGVGKTELAKALAEFLFDDEEALVRIDMSEYMEQSKVNNLIGSAIGYVGSEKGGILTEAVRLKPYSVVLFDEAEKAHPDVFNILLQLMDEGRLTDSQGRRVDFTNTVVILTSNVGSKRIMDITASEDFSQEALEEEIEQILREHFRPEFLNRLDKKIPFRALDFDDIKKIGKIQERKVQKLLTEQNLLLDLQEDAMEFLAEEGYEPEYGARPLKRSFMQHLQQPLAIEVLEGKFSPGDTIIVHAGEDEEGLVFEKSDAKHSGAAE